ncbi:21332_t:CDS:1, partial [Racocetra persica]
FHKEVANLKTELIENNKQIAILNKRYADLLDKYKRLQKDYTILHNDNEALLENNSDYYVERCHLLIQENDVLVKR